MAKKSNIPVFKEYTMGQMVLLPVDLEEEIEPNHLVRVVNTTIERMDLSMVYAQYAGGGTSSYHPKMLLKVLIYAYSQQIYSSRKIAKALRENIYFMWLSGNSHPDFHTINRFRGVVVKETITEIFAAVLTILVEGGYVKLENYFVDGTKLEANASKYSFVWAKNTQRYQEQVKVKVSELLEEIERLNAAEDGAYGEGDLPERGGAKTLDAAQLEQRINELNERLRQMTKAEAPTSLSSKGEPPSEAGAPDGVQSEAVAEPGKTEPGQEGKAKPKGAKGRPRHKSKAQQLAEGIHKLAEEYLPRLQKYEAQEAILDGRNSYAKTDHAATFMRMKEDHMKNGQLKAGYNIQTGTENQFVVGFSVHQRPGDPGCLIPHLEETKAQRGGRQPKNAIADSAYGSEENYVYLEQQGIEAYVKYNTFHQETKPRHKPNPFAAENLPYDEATDVFTCPNGKLLYYQTTQRYHSDNGFESERRLYVCEDCSQCLLKQQCTKGEGNRQIKVSFRLWKMRAQAKEKLLSESGTVLRKQRSIDVETVFGRIKQDWGFRRFLLRGLQKVKTEWGLLCIAHNIAKLAVA
jgi:transposase